MSAPSFIHQQNDGTEALSIPATVKEETSKPEAKNEDGGDEYDSDDDDDEEEENDD